MWPLRIFLAKFFGLYCIIVALAMMTRKQTVVSTITALINNPPVALLVEGLGLASGLAMVIGHNVWVGRCTTGCGHAVAWLMTIPGVGLLALPPEAVMRVYEVKRCAMNNASISIWVPR